MDNKEQNNYNFSSVDLLIYIWKKRYILIIVGFLAGIGSIIASLMITPMYKSNVIMFPVTNASISKWLISGSSPGTLPLHGIGEEEQAEQLLQVLNSEPIRSRIIEKYDLANHYGIDPDSKYPENELLEAYKSNVNFRLTEYMSVEIVVMDSDPEYAANIANDISDLVDTVFNSMKKQRSRAALKLVENAYMESEKIMDSLSDSLQFLTSDLFGYMNSKSVDEMMASFLETFSEYGGKYIATVSRIRQEIGRYLHMKLQYQEARIEAMNDLPYKFVVEKAFPAEKKAYPKKSLIVIVSTLASLLFALIVLIIIDNIRNRISTGRA